MKKVILVLIAVVVILAIAVLLGLSQKAGDESVLSPTPSPTEAVVPTIEQPEADQITSEGPNPMNISSSAFEHNKQIPSKFTCDGANISPPLEFADIPDGTESLALIVDDPDAPSGDWVHWLIWNIAPNIINVDENRVPAGGIQGITSFGNSSYGGPCPPSGTHRYFYKLYALDTELSLPNSAQKSDLLVAMEGHILANTELVGLYKRE